MHALLRMPVVLPLVATILLMLLVQSTRRQVSCRVGAPLDVESVDSIASVRDEVRKLREMVENDTHRRHEDKVIMGKLLFVIFLDSQFRYIVPLRPTE